MEDNSKNVDKLEVAAALVIKKGHLLISQRLQNDDLGGLWEFPGGKIKLNESPQSCIVRELKEELGIYVEPIRLFDVVSYEYPNKKVKLYFYVCRLISGAPHPIQCADVRWVPFRELNKYNFLPADVAILKKLELMDELSENSVNQQQKT